jgi:hypothetical protein
LIEDDDYAAFVARSVRALVRRAAADPETLPLLVKIRQQVDDGIGEAARALHAEHGFSWSEIASRLGITRQSAHERFTR